MESVNFKSHVYSPEMQPILVSIEGNIGAGKSYLLKSLRAAHPDWCFIDEPVDFWQSLKNGKDESILELFYGDPKRWSYTFQNCALLSRYQNIEAAVRGTANEGRKVFITERCLDTDYEVFAKMLHADGIMDPLEFELYQRWFRILQRSAVPLSAIVYVDTDPDMCFERVAERARSGEAGISLEYLNSLDRQQDAWVKSTAVPQLRIKSNEADKVEAFVAGLVTKSE